LFTQHWKEYSLHHSRHYRVLKREVCVEKKEHSVCQSSFCPDLVKFLVSSQIKPHAPQQRGDKAMAFLFCRSLRKEVAEDKTACNSSKNVVDEGPSRTVKPKGPGDDATSNLVNSTASDCVLTPPDSRTPDFSDLAGNTSSGILVHRGTQQSLPMHSTPLSASFGSYSSGSRQGRLRSSSPVDGDEASIARMAALVARMAAFTETKKTAVDECVHASVDKDSSRARRRKLSQQRRGRSSIHFV